MTYDETLSFLQQREAKFNRHDANALAADHTDTGVVRSPIFPHVQGVVNIQGSYRALFTMFADWHITFEAPIIDGDRAAHAFTARATHVGEFLGMPGTGRKFQIIGAAIYRLDDGLIAEERRIYDFTGLLLQVGVLKGKPGPRGGEGANASNAECKMHNVKCKCKADARCTGTGSTISLGDDRCEEHS